MRAGAAADTEVADPELGGGAREVGQLEACAGEGVERHRERPLEAECLSLRVAERLEARRVLIRPVRNGQGSQVAVDRRANPAEERQHRPRATNAIEPDDVCAGVREPLAGLLGRPPVPGLGLAVDRQREDCRQPGALDRLESQERLRAVREGLSDHVVDAGLGGPTDLLLEHGADPAAGFLVRCIDVRVADVAGKERATLLGDLLGEHERLAVQPREHLLLADQAELDAVGVVREGLNDVGARVDELAVELRHELRVIQHDLGHVGAGLEVAAPLQLEEVALGADHGAVRKPLEQTGSHEGRG